MLLSILENYKRQKMYTSIRIYTQVYVCVCHNYKTTKQDDGDIVSVISMDCCWDISKWLHVRLLP